jgi:hypothetical protein
MRSSNSGKSSVPKRSFSMGSPSRRLTKAVAAAVLEALETRRLLTAFSSTGSIQTYAVPTTGIYDISIAGAQGGDANNTGNYESGGAETGGLGAVFSGDVSLTAGSVLQVVVGGQGTTDTFSKAGGGGGGTFVFVSGAAQPIVVAGGGGGAKSNTATTGTDAQTGESGSTPVNSGHPGTGGTAGSGGTGGGTADAGGGGGGGAGWLGNGGNAPGGNYGGLGAPTFAGGDSGQEGGGGFGGGGGGSDPGGGGGGGYSGGGGGSNVAGPDGGGGGGGGGSYIADVTNLTSAVTETGDGYFDITPLSTPAITSAAQPASAYVGTTIADKAAVTGGDSPTGTVTFNLYNNDTATGPALFTDTETLSGGTATSAGFPTTAAGTDYWVATYNGDSNNSYVSTVENADPVTVTGSLVVTTTSDSPTAIGNTLRDAIAYANSLTGAQTVTFASALTSGGPATITLTGGELDITGSLTITGPGANELTIDGGQNGDIFVVNDQVDALQNDAITGLTLTNSFGAIDNSENLTLSGDVISNNVGSGAVNEPDATLTSSDDAFIGNTADGSGGGVNNNGTFFSSNDTFSGNSSVDGGAIANLNDATLTDDTITQNKATNPPPSTTGYAGGVFTVGGTLTLADTIIAGNSAAQNDPDVLGAFTSQGHNLIGDGTSGTGFVASDQVGTGAVPINAMVGTLGNYGGTTPTVPLLAGSPTIGAGAPADYSGTTTPIITDQRGVPRPPTPDIGAFEYVYSLVVNSSADNVNDDNISGPTVTLREAVNYADAYPGNPTITFAPELTASGPATITLTDGNLDITGALTITGPGANELTIDGDKTAQIVVDSSSQTTQNVAITGLTITDAPGAIDDSENLTLSGDVISNNTGPGVTIESGGTLTSSADSFVGNVESQFGAGGISNFGTLYSSNDTFSGNSGPNGGGIYSEGTGTLTDDTITQNHAVDSFPTTGYGGGVLVLTGTLTIANTIIAGNSADVAGPDVSGAFTSSGHNLIGDGTGSTGLTNGVNGDQVGNTLTPINPLLGTLGNYGGTTETMPLLPGSPAIGAGVTTDYPGTTTTITTDQTGYTRSLTAPSIGAYENEGFTISGSGTPQSTDPGTAFTTPLGVTVTSNNALLTSLAGGVITLAAPTTGASATFGTNPITLAANSTGSTKATANATPGGPYNVTASATGITTPATFSLTNLATPSISTTQEPATAAVGSTIADKATVIGGLSPGGTVTFVLYNNATAAGTPLFTDTETLSGGSATSKGFKTTATGMDYWVDTYNGNGDNEPVTSGDAAEPVNVTSSVIGSKTVVSSSSDPSVIGQQVKFTANVTPTSGNGTPTGTVQFYVDKKAYGSAVVLTNDKAQISDSSLGLGGHTVTATYTSSSTNFTGSSSASFSQTVNKATTTFSKLSGPTIIVMTPSVTLSGTISGNGSVAPTGYVTITITYASGPRAGQVAAVTSGKIGAGGKFSGTVYAFPGPVGSYKNVYSYGGDASNAATSATTYGALTYGVSIPGGKLSAKKGSVLAVQLELTDAQGHDLSGSGVPLTAKGIASTSSPETVKSVPAGSSSFTYSHGIYQMNLQTTTLSPGNYLLYFTAAGDLVEHSIEFTIT